MGDPVGADDEKPELIWKFSRAVRPARRLAGLLRGAAPESSLLSRPRPDAAEDRRRGARGLDDFSLDGGDRKWMRKMLRRSRPESCTFEIVDRRVIIDELRVISDSWLAEKKTREKGFSLGFFAEAYVRPLPVAIVKKEDRIVAFANLWEGAGKSCRSI